MKRDKYQRIAYAIKRSEAAVYRAIVAKNVVVKNQALAWAKAWGARGRF